MKILFLNPNRCGQGSIPLNIPLLISCLKAQGHDVRLFDFSDYQCFDAQRESYEGIFFKRAEFDVRRVVSERKAFYRGNNVKGTSLRSSDYRSDFRRLISEFRPGLIAVSCLSVDFATAESFLSAFKKKFCFPVVFGGIHSILLPEEVLQSPVCDYVCTQEGEQSIVELAAALEKGESASGIKGIWFKRAGKIIKNPPRPLTNLAKLPLPDYTCFDPVHFWRAFDGKRYKMLNYELSRGCLFNCAYCVNGVLKKKYAGLGNYHRVKDIGQSISELKRLIKNYGFNFIRFWDEDFTSLGEKFLSEYADAYKEIGLPFLIYARLDTVTQSKARILKEMGCRTFAMGIESGNEFIRRKVMGRNISNNDIIDKFALVKSFGIRVSSYNIMGSPYESRQSIFETIDLNRRVNPDSFSVTLLEPYRGTPIRKMCERQGLDPFAPALYNKVQFVPPGMSKRELSGLFRTFPFYVRLPKSRYNEIGRAEKDARVYKNLNLEFGAFK